MKSTSYYSNGMIALKTYRSGINITKNIQNNTLNQQNNFETKTIEENKTLKQKSDNFKEKVKELEEAEK
jgi:hypothetical protein